MSENIRQKRLKILEYFDAYICLIFSDIKMLIFGLSFLLFVLQPSGRNGFLVKGVLKIYATNLQESTHAKVS